MKPHQDPKFRELQDEWYEKLRETGFEDAEKSGNLRQSAAHNHWTVSALDKQQREEYYRVVYDAVHNNKNEFQSWSDRVIMHLHSEGKTNSEIAQIMRSSKLSPVNRETIRKVIRTYLDSWGILSFTEEQLDPNYKRKQKCTKL